VLLVAAAVVVAVGAAVQAGVHGASVEAHDVPVRLTLAALAAIAAAALAARWRQDRRHRIALISAACACWTLGQLVDLVSHRWDGDARLQHGWAHLPLVLFAVLASCSVAARLRRFDLVRRIGFAADAVLVGTATVSIVSELWLREALAGRDGWTQASLTAVPSLEIGVAALALVVVVQDRTRTALVATAAFVLIAAADVVVSAAAGEPDGGRFALVAAAWAAGFALLAALAGVASVARVAPDDRVSNGLLRVVVVSVPALVAAHLLIGRHLVGDGEVDAGTAVLGLLYVLVLVTHQLIRSWEGAAAARRLLASHADLEVAEAQLRTLLDDLPQAVVVLDREGRVRDANALATRLTARDRSSLIGLHVLELVAAADRDEVARRWAAAATDDRAERATRVLLSLAPPADPSMIVEVDVLLPFRDPARVPVTVRDVTATVREARALERARERFRLAFHGAPIGMALTSALDGRIIEANESLLDMLGTTAAELQGRRVSDVTHPLDWEREVSLVAHASSWSDETYRLEKRFIRADGGEVWTRTWISFLEDVDGERLAIAHVEDVTEQRRSAEQLRWAATHDELTRLPNRACFTAELTSRLADRPAGSIAVLFVDLDNFKVVNDTLGHAVGDQLLRGMTERLLAVLREDDMLSRFGGDEFIVLLGDVGDDASPRAMAERLRQEIGRPLVVDGVELFVTGSIGIAVADVPGTTASDLLRHADAAMYRAKARGRDCVEVFAPGSHDASVLALRTSGELRRAVERGEIVPYYQPIVDLATGLLTGFEVLARWRHPDRGLLGADQFLPMAEETGLIADVGASILRASLVQLGRWRERLPTFADLTLSVNVSGRQLLSDEFVGVVGDALAEAGVPAGSLWLEITETALMTDVKAATVALRELRSIGLHLSVDDFGTGYSSLTYLKRFPVGAIKIDRSFVNGLGIDAEDSTIVEAVVNLGHSLGLRVVAEGVETPLQLSRLRELGCDLAQGYLFGRPRPAEIIELERAPG